MLCRWGLVPGGDARRHMQHKQHMVLAVFLFKDTVACSTQ